MPATVPVPFSPPTPPTHPHPIHSSKRVRPNSSLIGKTNVQSKITHSRACVSKQHPMNLRGGLEICGAYCRVLIENVKKTWVL